MKLVLLGAVLSAVVSPPPAADERPGEARPAWSSPREEDCTDGHWDCYLPQFCLDDERDADELCPWIAEPPRVEAAEPVPPPARTRPAPLK
jgi:hypothetical protein